jgi:hypothetical protein
MVKATALQKKGNYAVAIGIYDSILSLQPDDITLAARAISNRPKQNGSGSQVIRF